MSTAILTRVVWVLLFVGVVYLIYRAGGFTADNMERTGKLFDTRGGNIMILVVLTMIFFSSGIGIGYHILGMVEAKTITSDNTMAVMLIQFVTGTAFGTALGALIQLLGGSKSQDK